MMVPSSYQGNHGFDSYRSSGNHGFDSYGSPSDSWYRRSVWQQHGNYDTNAWGVSKPPQEKSQYQFGYQPGGRQDGGQINCGSQWVCGATMTSDGASRWPVPVANDLPNAFNMIVQMCHGYFDYFEQTCDQMHKQTSRLAQQVAFTQDSMGTLAKDMQQRPNFRSSRDWQDFKNGRDWHGDMSSNYNSHMWNGSHGRNFNDMDMFRQMDERMRRLESAFQHMEGMQSDFGSNFGSNFGNNKYGNFHNDFNKFGSNFGSKFGSNFGNNFSNWNMNGMNMNNMNSMNMNNMNSMNMNSRFNESPNEMQFRDTLRDGEFFDKWHYQDQRIWKLEQWFCEMSKRMNFSDMEMQMNSWMNNHNNHSSTFGMRSSWMDKKHLGNYGSSFSHMGNYGNGSYDCHNYDSKNMQIAPPSGCRTHSARPGFANRFNNYSGNYGSKSYGMYDDHMSNRFNNFSGGGFGNSGYRPGAMYDDHMFNRFNNYGFKSGSMYDDYMPNRFNNYSTGNYGFKSAVYDDGFCGMYGSKYGGMSNNMGFSSNMGFASPRGGHAF